MAEKTSTHLTRFLVLTTLLLGISLLRIWAVEPAPQETSVNPGINNRWKSDDIEPLIDILEKVNRDIFTHRKRLAQLVNPVQGAVVADVGAGSGFMVEEFARRVGPEGLVYAVDINLRLLERIENRANKDELKNIKTILATDDSSRLPANSVDLIFICDTYHHFEYPKSTLQTIYSALRSEGEMVVVEFWRIPGESDAWILDHVRDGKEAFTQEILDAGFGFVEEHEAPFLPRNYVLRFRKP